MSSEIPFPFSEPKEISNRYESTIGPPFKPIPIRQIWDPIDPGSVREKRLSEEEVQELIDNPMLEKSTRLSDMSIEANKEEVELQDSKKIYNMSVKNILTGTSDSVISTIDDLLNYRPSDGLYELINIFAKENRLIYLGILIVIFSLIIIGIRQIDGHQ